MRVVIQGLWEISLLRTNGFRGGIFEKQQKNCRSSYKKNADILQVSF